MPIKVRTLLRKKNRSYFFTIGSGIWKTSNVGKKWNGENMDLLQMHAYIKVLDIQLNVKCTCTCMVFSCVSLTSKRTKTSLIRLSGKPDHTCNVKLTPNLSSVGRHQNKFHVFFSYSLLNIFDYALKKTTGYTTLFIHIHGHVWRHAVSHVMTNF